ncbi:hypothetical protein AYJ54_08030 [Bradyrhizobium centrolobii]|uniref:Uncharacterized protein n=1 Tax=Bradyrhizobium centrolobii TaxID=1505087 RepID=A0A176YWP1_9BRAD|nr:hypothetical protein [Bradyrhizobium centrolobii]OAF11797.1 hypothetical protein AYJ54_08030 [Bradyrhizobium centrolobii]
MIKINERGALALLQRESEASFDQLGLLKGIDAHLCAGVNAAAAPTREMNSRRLMTAYCSRLCSLPLAVITQPRKETASPDRGV